MNKSSRRLAPHLGIAGVIAILVAFILARRFAGPNDGYLDALGRTYVGMALAAVGIILLLASVAIIAMGKTN